MDTPYATLPETVKALVDERVSEGGYDDASEYICELIQTDQRRKAEVHLDALLLEGLNSGAPIEVTAEFWQTSKRKLAECSSKHERQKPSAAWGFDPRCGLDDNRSSSVCLREPGT
jgi:antitoxin ParD1/3/4